METSQVVGKISYIGISPIKSARMMELVRAELTPEGMESEVCGVKIRDRQFMIVKKEPDSNGVHNFVTQRGESKENEYCASGLPVLALIRPQILSGMLYMNWEGKDAIPVVPSNMNLGKEIPCGIWGKLVNAVDQGDALARWLSEHLEMQVRLVKAAGSFRRTVSQKYESNNNTLRFQDGYPVHWFTRESVWELCQRAEKAINFECFRPNIVTEGGDSQAEHMVHLGKINRIPFVNPKPCDRCPTTLVDQDHGRIGGKEPLQTLAKYMKWRNREGKPKVIFGENMLPLWPGEIKIGDEVIMTAARDPPLVYGPKV
jgi:uncharacterized protein YcbX